MTLVSFAPVSARLSSINPVETTYVGEELEVYFSHGVTLRPGDVVVDAGANIGMFSAAVHDRLEGRVRLLAFEPIPMIYEVLQRNAEALFAGTLTALPCGLGSADQQIAFTYFPDSTVMSSCHRVPDDLRTDQSKNFVVVAARARWKAVRLLPRWMVRSVASMVLRRTARSAVTCMARIRPLSEVLDEQGIERVDLLKIDVEGSELETLAGIADRHWPLIQQIVLEVEQWPERRPLIEQMLGERGFTVHCEQDPIMSITGIGMIYARR